MNRTVISAAMLTCLCAGTALAQTTFVQWNFNASNTTPNVNLPGTPTTVGYVGGVVAPGTGQFPVGSDGGPSFSSSTYPAQGTGSGTAGVQFTASTAGFSNVQLSYFAQASTSASRFVRIKYTTDGINYDFHPSAPRIQNFTSFGTLPNTVDFTGIAGVDNNPNFGFQIVTVFDDDLLPATQYSAARISPPQTYSTGGTLRYDVVTLSGTAVVSVPPGATGRATPAAVCQTSGTTLIEVVVTPGQNPAPASHVVVADLTALGGSATQALTDDGLNGDLIPGDNVFSFSTSATGATGIYDLPFTVTDNLNRTASGNIRLGVGDCAANSASTLVISQVYGGGGNSNAIYNADFVELYNRGGAPVDMTGLSLQYASATAAGGFTDLTGIVPLSGTINPGQRMLVKYSGVGLNGIDLPAPDFSASNSFSGLAAAAGRVVLVTGTEPLGAACGDARVLDLVGYGATAVCFEGAGSVGNLANDLAAVRKNFGVQDTNNNFFDFDVNGPFPQNSGISRPPTVTGGVSNPGTVCPGTVVVLSAAAGAGANPTSAVTGVTGNLTAIGGGASVVFVDDGSNGDVTPGDGVYTATATVGAMTPAGTATLTLTATDGENRTGTGNIVLNVGVCQPAVSDVVISAVYGGGGNNGAVFNADFVEIHNRSAAGVTLDGYSVQYASANGNQALGTSNGLVALSGCIGAGEFRLVQMSGTGTNGAALPTPDFTAPVTFVGMSATGGVVALVNSGAAATGCTDGLIVDKVGYGAATCFEGAGPAGVTANATGVARKGSGTQDTDESFNDFEVVTPAPRNGATVTNPCAPGGTCTQDYNGIDGINGDDLADYIADFFDSTGIQPGFGDPIAIPGGFAGNATAAFTGFGRACPGAIDVPQPNPWGAPVDAYRTGGFKVSLGINNDACSNPNGDDLADYISVFFNGCP
jgi:hypothetical protein